MVVTKANQPTNQPPPEQNNNKQCQTEIGLHSQRKNRRQTLGKMIQHFCWAQSSAWKSYFQQHFGV